MNTEPTKSPGQILYETYWQGNEVFTWRRKPKETHLACERAAQAVIAQDRQRIRVGLIHICDPGGDWTHEDLIALVDDQKFVETPPPKLDAPQILQLKAD